MAKVELKQPIVEEIKASLDGAKGVVLVDHRGLTVEQDTVLRKSLREAGVTYKVYKNTLVKRAIEGTEFESLKDLFTTPGRPYEGNEEEVINEKAHVLDLILPVAVLIASCIVAMVYTGGFFEGASFAKSSISSTVSAGLAIVSPNISFVFGLNAAFSSSSVASGDKHRWLSWNRAPECPSDARSKDLRNRLLSCSTAMRPNHCCSWRWLKGKKQP